MQIPSKSNESGYTLLQKIQFYIGSGGRSVISGLVNAAFIKYYTDFIGLDPKWMGYVFVIFTVWAAVNDPIIGLWLDKRHYKKRIGKYRPIFIRSIPFWVVITLAFPWANPSWSQLGISIYLFIALMLWETAATIYSTSYGAVAVNLFLTTDERAEVEVIDNYVGALTIFGSTIPIMILTMDISSQTMLFFFGVVTIASGLIMAISIPAVREREDFYQNENLDKVSLKEFFVTTLDLLKENAFLYYFLTFFMIQTVASNYLIGLSFFYDNLVLSAGFWTGLPDILIGIMGLVLFVFIAKWIQRFGTKIVLSRMILFSLVGYILLAFVPASQEDALYMVNIYGIEFPGERSYWLATFMYFVI
jgi:GPH family glycoside/pentoside/hexuronide:cation symporter